MNQHNQYGSEAELIIRLIKEFSVWVSEIENYLRSAPSEWGGFQNEFNNRLINIFMRIMEFDKENNVSNQENKTYELRKFFIENYRSIFLRGIYTKHSFEKPYGYAGDFKIIDYIYLNHPTTSGVDRLFDNFFLSSPASAATRNRKEDFKRYLSKALSLAGQPIMMLDLASGPCRDLKEFLVENKAFSGWVNFLCLDGDANAIEHAKLLLDDRDRVEFKHENVVRIALKKNVVEYMGKQFDLIFSTGLFDYLDGRLATRLVANLKKLLRPGGKMIISNYRDKYSNPSLHFMEWVGDWPLVYRSDEEFRKIFLDAGFKMDDLSFDYEMQGIMIYYVATNN